MGNGMIPGQAPYTPEEQARLADLMSASCELTEHLNSEELDELEREIFPPRST